MADNEIDYDELYKEDKPEFIASTLEEALREAQRYCRENEVEYSYYFVGY